MTKSYNTFPLYKGQPLIGSALEYARNPLSFFEEKRKQFGDNYFITFPGRKVLVVGSPDLMHHIYSNSKTYTKDKIFDHLTLVIGNGLITNEREQWKRQRKLAQPAFYKSNLMKLYQLMVDVSQDVLNKLLAKSQSSEAIEISGEMQIATSRIVMKCLFSKDFDDGLREVHDSITFGLNYVSKIFVDPTAIPLSYINGKRRQFKKSKAALDEMVLSLIKERKNSSEDKADLLQMLIDARFEDTGEPLSETALMDELLNIFFAGHETSAVSLSWTLYLLAQHPEILGKLRAEIKQVTNGELPTFEQSKQLVYCNQVVKESLRLYPPIWVVPRYTLEDDEWNGMFIPKGTFIFNLTYMLHHKPEIYPEPAIFDPERFHPDAIKERPHNHYYPFGGAPRKCIGDHFAALELVLMLSGLVTKFDFELVEGQKIQPNPITTLKPMSGIHMKLTPRR